jgi:squalene-hopene/tetraprenyl-beta-curcumene cyclase
MDRSLRWAIVVLSSVVAVALPACQARPDAAVPSRWNPRAAAKYLDRRADWWLGWSGSARGQGTACISCHTTLPFALARAALREHLNETTPGAAEKRLLDGVNKRVERWAEISGSNSRKDPFLPFYSGDRKASALGTEAVVNALVLVNQGRANKGLSVPARKALGHLWEQQQANGAWLWLDFGLNPWEKDGAFYGASLAALAVGTAGKDCQADPGVAAKVAALKKYLREKAPGQPLHHRAVSLWASSRLPGILTEQERKSLVEALLTAQEADGGWSLAKLGKTASGQGGWSAHGVYPKGEVSDGYATGLVVLALRSAGVAADNPKLEKGLSWLGSRQKDGTWPASYLNKQRNAQTDTGKFMRDAATAFAVLALTG